MRIGKSGYTGGAIGMILLGLILLFGVFGSQISDGVKDWRSDPATEAFIVATGGGVTTGNVTLSYDLFQAVTAEVTSITSTVGTDTPVATSYVEATKVLTISGLTASTSRTLTIIYTAETEDTGMRTAGPYLLFLVFGIAIFFLVQSSKK
jgi:hypothetical protein